MESLVFVLLPIALLLVCAIGVLAFLDVAFARTSAGSTADMPWPRLPLLSGDSLRGWAAGVARQVVSRYAQRPRTAETPIALAHEIEGLTSRIIDKSLQQTHRSHAAGEECVQCSHEAIRITAPETLAIVEDLRRRLSRRELEDIRNRAEQNIDSLNINERAHTGIDQSVCPLLSQDGCCASYGSRPVYCRGHCPNCVADAGLSVKNKQRPDAEFAATVGQGITEGLTQGLTAAGFDGQLYDLNEALLRALDSPDASARWARGEAVLESHRQI